MTKLRYAAFAVPLTTAGWLWLGSSPPAVEAGPPAARANEIVAPGRVEPVHDPVKLAFESQGRIAEITVDEDDTVHAGQVLARLDDGLARIRIAAAEAGVAVARARYALARHGARPQDIAAARADAEAAAVAARHRVTEQARSAQLGRSGALAATAVDADDTAAQIAAARATAATARYEALSRGTRREQLDEAAAAVALAEAELAAAHVALEQTVLRAPGDGVILRRTAEIGTLVTLSNPQPVVSMADLGQLAIRVEVDEADVAAIAVGQNAYATAYAFGEQRFPVVVGRVTRELGRKTVRDDDPRARVDTRVLEVIARFTGPTGSALPLGMRMQVHIGRPTDRVLADRNER